MLIASLSFKWALATSTMVSGVIGTILGEMLTNQWGSAGIAGVIAASVGAFFVFIPRFMEQRRKNVETFSQVREKEVASTVQRLTALCEREKGFINLQLAEAILTATLERQAKHDAIGELTGAQSHNQILVEQILRAGMEPLVTLHPVDFRRFSGSVDERIREMREKTVETARAAVNKVTNDEIKNGEK